MERAARLQRGHIVFGNECGPSSLAPTMRMWKFENTKKNNNNTQFNQLIAINENWTAIPKLQIYFKNCSLYSLGVSVKCFRKTSLKVGPINKCIEFWQVGAPHNKMHFFPEENAIGNWDSPLTCILYTCSL